LRDDVWLLLIQEGECVHPLVYWYRSHPLLGIAVACTMDG
jgi:hypothetical protein